jgi:hypothetical protein
MKTKFDFHWQSRLLVEEPRVIETGTLVAPAAAEITPPPPSPVTVTVSTNVENGAGNQAVGASSTKQS